MEINLIEHECPTCHVLYWLTEAHDTRLVNTKVTYYCPNGHGAVYKGKSDKQKLEEVTEELRLLEIENTDLRKAKKAKLSKKKK